MWVPFLQSVKVCIDMSQGIIHNPAFNCDQCGRSYSRSGNLEMHKRTCTGPIVAPALKRPRTASAVPEFTVRRKKGHLVVHQRCMKWI